MEKVTEDKELETVIIATIEPLKQQKQKKWSV